MNHILKTAVLAGAFALCSTLFGCATSAPSGDPVQVDTSAAITANSGAVCDDFCHTQGGQFFDQTFATSEAQCDQKGGEWFTADQGYPGPPPGCCCKCALEIGDCL